MTTIWRLASVILASLVLVGTAHAAEREALETLLREFLAASSTAAAHARFWADDLVYTSSDGTRFGKSDILAGFENSETNAAPPTRVYSGDQVDIRLYGDVAVVAFRLVSRPMERSESDKSLFYFNTGTFQKRNGVWKAIAWQATRIPAE